jgi:cobalt-zinc-cadmium efflux system outer membrane protein
MPLVLALLLAQAAPDIQEPALPSPLSLEQAEQIFLTHGLDLLVAEAQVGGAEGDLRAAHVVQNPTANGDFLYGFAVNSSGGNVPAVPGWSVGLTDNAAIEDILAGKRGLRIDVAGRALEAARHNRDDARRTLLTQVRNAFTAALLAEQNLDFADEVQKSYQETRNLNETRYQKGSISQVDLTRVVVAQLESQQQRDQAAAQLIQAKATLAFLLGSRSHPLAFALEGDLAYRPLPRIDAASPEDLSELALTHRPDLLASVASREQSGFAVAQAKRVVFPDISLQLGYSQQYVTTQANGVISPPTLSIGLQAPLPLFYQQQGEVRRAEANLLAAEAQEQKAHGQVVADVTQADAGYHAARDMVRRMEGELLKNAKQARDLEELLYRKGAASLLDYLDAQRTYTAINLEYRQDLQAYWNAVYQLEQATGTELR